MADEASVPALSVQPPSLGILPSQASSKLAASDLTWGVVVCAGSHEGTGECR